VNPADQARRRLDADVVRTVGRMHSLLADARRLGAPIPEPVALSVHLWRAWANRLRDWAEGEGR
jgi:hypothetical protein